MKRIFIITFFSVLLSQMAYAQILSPLFFNEELLESQIPQLNEFTKRFNSHIDSVQYSYEAEARTIMKLLNRELIWDSNGQLIASDTTQKNIIDFIRNVSDSSIQLHFADTSWFARAECSAQYKDKNLSLVLYLRTRTIGPDEFCWKICGAEADWLLLHPQKENNGLILSPIENELRFISLPYITKKENGNNILNYMSDEHAIDPLSVLMALIYTGDLSINFVKEITYFFYQVPGFYFTVENFDRNERNAGWLISQIQRFSEQK